MSRFISELHRRRVFATAGIYIVGAWLVMQGGDVFFSGWGIPDRGINVLLIAAISGFPLALVFGWFFNITKHGIRRTLQAVSDEVEVSRPLKGGDYIVLATLFLISGVIITRASTEILAMRSAVPVPRSVAVEKMPNSIAVLPFTNMSSDPENEYFCDGVSEEILNRLARYVEINVIGRTSSWQFKDSDSSIREMTDLLGVHHLLRGSVQKAGDRLRISARLVDDAGTQVWGETFDRTLEDVFAIQSQIAEFVATAVAPKVAPQPDIAYKPDLAAYDHFLRGREFLHRRNKPRSLEELQLAVELDPGFAEAYAELGIAILIQSFSISNLDKARDAIDTALTLVPGMPRALAAKGLLFIEQDPPDYDLAENTLRQALEQQPHMVDAMNWMASALASKGKNAEAYALYYRAHGYDPLHPSIAANLAASMVELGDFEDAEQLLLPLLQIPNPSKVPFIVLRDLYWEAGQLVKMNEIERLQAQKGLHVYFGLALSYAMLAMWDQADYWLDRTVRDFPDWGAIALYPTFLDEWQGRYSEAVEALNHSVSSLEIDPADLSWYPQFYGTYLAMAGDYQGAVEVLQPYYEIRQGTMSDPRFVDAQHALALALLRTDQTNGAKALLESIEEHFQRNSNRHNMKHSSSMLYFMAGNASLLEKNELALQRLRKAIDAGWRGYYIFSSDPRWDSLKDDPGYRAMMVEVRADVDRQREIVEKLDAKQDLPALVDESRARRGAEVR